MFLIAVRNFLKLCRFHKTFAFLSVLSLAISILSFLVLVEKGMYIYQYHLEQEYAFVKSSSSEDLVSLYGTIVSDESFPQITSVSFIDDQYTGISYDASRFQMFMPYGKLFSQEELEAGANVALLSLEYIRLLPQQKAAGIWSDGITIDENHLTVVGCYTDIARYFSVSELALDYPMPTLVVLPAKTYFALGRKPFMLNCRFDGSLTKEQQNTLTQTISSYKSVDAYYVPGTRDSIQNSFLETLSAYSVLFVMSLIAVVVIMVAWFQSERERYRVYLVYGAKRRHIIFFCTIDIFLLYMIAHLGALTGLRIINLWFEGLFLAPLPGTWHLLIGIGTFVLCWLIVSLRSYSLLKYYRNVSSSEVA